MNKSVKLSNWQREEIVKRALEHAYKERDKASADFMNDAAEKVYAAEFKHDLEKINSLPDFWFNYSNHISVNAGGWRVDLKTDKRFKVPASNNPNNPIPSGWWSGNYCFNVKDVEFAKKIQEHAAIVEKNNESRKKDKVILKAKLSSITTLKRLEELWPEGKPFYEWLIERSEQSTALTVEFTDINEKFGLPIED